MHWSTFCLFYWWQRNFKDAHEYRLLEPLVLQWDTRVYEETFNVNS